MLNSKSNNTLLNVGLASVLCLGVLLTSAISVSSQDSTKSRSGSTATDKPEVVTLDALGERDTLVVNVESIGESSWKVDVSCFNDEDLFGLSIPLKFTSGLRKVYIDSTIFTGGRVDHFQVKFARADSAIQRLTIGLIAALSPNAKILEPGDGSIATVYLHAEGQGKGLLVDTTTTAPQNSLLFIYSDMKDGNLQLKIYPEVLINGELAVKPKDKSSKKSKK